MVRNRWDSSIEYRNIKRKSGLPAIICYLLKQCANKQINRLLSDKHIGFSSLENHIFDIENLVSLYRKQIPDRHTVGY